ncbi:hypothetical protein LOK49_LG07G03371 [Camellia lanceoleosa]|uniref:Uncharacterized protein n=1 Tax=Camellia lanceoleosa TaxID=1840588 RepID=A0ACC0H7K1_9ERIC|nr:hypothetical protein LOK49_LG07G03371 [Camellia lanceoleosa]
MGNCIKKESSMQWGGEDWGSPASETLFSGEKSYNKATNIEEKSATPASVKEVKIKITKKQLEELLGKMDVQGLSVQQMLSQLLMNGSDRFETHQRSWRPALKSIPEVN